MNIDDRPTDLALWKFQMALTPMIRSTSGM